MALRYLEKFTDSSGGVSYTFPLSQYEMEQSQPLSVPFSPVTGADYAYNQLATSYAPKGNGIEVVRFLAKSTTEALVDTEIDNARSKLYTAGKGKLYALDAAGTRRWAWARLMEMPQVRLAVGNILHQPVVLNFQRFSDWYGTTQTSVNVTLNAASQSFTVNNAGNARVFNAIFIVKGTFTDPVVTNTTNGYRLKSTRDGSNANHWLKFDAGVNSVSFSTDGGSSYSGDWSNFVRLSGQVGLMVLEPGDNAFTWACTGAPSGTLSYSFYPAYH